MFSQMSSSPSWRPFVWFFLPNEITLVFYFGGNLGGSLLILSMLGPMRSDLGEEVGLPFVVAVVVVVVEGGATPRIAHPSNRPEWTEV